MFCFSYGFNYWMQNADCSLESNLYSISILSLSPTTIVLLITPKHELAFFDVSSVCAEDCTIMHNHSQVRFLLIYYQYPCYTIPSIMDGLGLKTGRAISRLPSTLPAQLGQNRKTVPNRLLST